MTVCRHDIASHRRLRRIPRRGAFVLAFLFALLATSAAAAQNATTGTLEGTVDGEPRTWFTMQLEGEETGLPTATWADMMGMFTTFSIQAHPDRAYGVEGALSIEFTDMGGFPADCPCTYPDATVTMWTTSSMLENVYLDDAADVTILSIEPLGEDAYALEGTFTAEPVFHPSIIEGADESDRIEVEGRISIDRLPRDRTLE